MPFMSAADGSRVESGKGSHCIGWPGAGAPLEIGRFIRCCRQTSDLGGALHTREGIAVPATLGQWTQGYVVTSHRAQGRIPHRDQPSARTSPPLLLPESQ